MTLKWYNDLIHDIDNASEILEGERNGFLVSLMVLSSYVIQADGRIMHSEMEYVRNFLSEHFGEQKKNSCEQILMSLFAMFKGTDQGIWSKKIEKCTRELALYTSEEERLLLLAYLIKIVRADGVIENNEINSTKNVADWLDISLAAASQIDELKTEIYWTWTI